MHLLIIPSWYPYANRPLTGIFFREQALALREADYQVGVVAPIQKSIKEISGLSSFRSGGAYWVDDGGVATLREEQWSIPKFRRLNMSRWLACGRRLVEEYIAAKGRPDIVHAHSLLYAGMLAVEIKEIHQIPYVITEHSSGYARGLIHEWQLPYIRTAIREASWHLAVSQELAQLLGSFVAVPGRGWSYLPNMVDTDFFSGGPVEPCTDRKRPFVFFAAAFLTQNKGMHFLIEAFASNFAGAEVELWIGGDGEEKERLEQQTSKAGVNGRIRFLGQLDREQMRSTMQRCDAFVLPSFYETFGVVLIEALATGKPVIATRCGGPESIVNEKNGFLVDPANADALGGAMRQMIETRDRFHKETIRADCIARFSRRAVIGELGNIYRFVGHDG